MSGYAYSVIYIIRLSMTNIVVHIKSVAGLSGMQIEISDGGSAKNEKPPSCRNPFFRNTCGRIIEKSFLIRVLSPSVCLGAANCQMPSYARNWSV